MSSSPEANTAVDVSTDIEPAEKAVPVDEHTWRFIKIWKDTCEKEENIVEVC